MEQLKNQHMQNGWTLSEYSCSPDFLLTPQSPFPFGGSLYAVKLYFFPFLLKALKQFQADIPTNALGGLSLPIGESFGQYVVRGSLIINLHQRCVSFVEIFKNGTFFDMTQ